MILTELSPQTQTLQSMWTKFCGCPLVPAASLCQSHRNATPVFDLGLGRTQAPVMRGAPGSKPVGKRKSGLGGEKLQETPGLTCSPFPLVPALSWELQFRAGTAQMLGYQGPHVQVRSRSCRLASHLFLAVALKGEQRFSHIPNTPGFSYYEGKY